MMPLVNLRECALLTTCKLQVSHQNFLFKSDTAAMQTTESCDWLISQSAWLLHNYAVGHNELGLARFEAELASSVTDQ